MSAHNSAFYVDRKEAAGSGTKNLVSLRMTHEKKF